MTDRGSKRPPDGDNYNNREKRYREDRRDGDDRKRPKLMSTIAAVVQPASDKRLAADNDRWDPNDDDSVHAAKPAAREVETRPDSVQRNKRMLGALMGHLNTARKNLEADSTIKVQESIESSVVQKNKEQSVVAAREVSEKVGMLNDLYQLFSIELLLFASIKQEASLRDELLAKQLKNDIAHATATWKKNMMETRNFCMTDTEPRIAWIPGVVDDMTHRYVDMGKWSEKIDKLITEREESDESRIKEIDDDVVNKKALRLTNNTEKQLHAKVVVEEEANTDGVSESQEKGLDVEDGEC